MASAISGASVRSGAALNIEVTGDRYYRDLNPCQSAYHVVTDAHGYVDVGWLK